MTKRKRFTFLILLLACWPMFSCGDSATSAAGGGGGNERFVDHGDGTVTDLETNLMWQLRDDGIHRDWTTAAAYCGGLVLGAYSDWDWPACDELESLIDLRYSPTVDPVFLDTKTSHYWTSDPNAACCAWSVHFGNGTASNGFLRSSLFYVRCVRRP